LVGLVSDNSQVEKGILHPLQCIKYLQQQTTLGSPSTQIKIDHVQLYASTSTLAAIAGHRKCKLEL